jgi:hypothetical protein
MTRDYSPRAITQSIGLEEVFHRMKRVHQTVPSLEGYTHVVPNEAAKVTDRLPSMHGAPAIAPGIGKSACVLRESRHRACTSKIPVSPMLMHLIGNAVLWAGVGCKFYRLDGSTRHIVSVKHRITRDVWPGSGKTTPRWIYPTAGPCDAVAVIPA